MDAYIQVVDGDDILIVRTSDWVVIATCGSPTFANLVWSALNA